MYIIKIAEGLDNLGIDEWKNYLGVIFFITISGIFGQEWNIKNESQKKLRKLQTK